MSRREGAFEQRYPRITAWVTGDGWIEMGRDEYSRSLVRALDAGGLVWEGAEAYETLEDALQALEEGLAEWVEG